MDKLYWLLSGFVLTLFVMLLRALLGKRMNAGLRYALWGLVLLRLLIPGTVLHSRVSVAAAADRAMDTAVMQQVDKYMTNTRVYAGAINKTEMSKEEAIAAHPEGWLHEVNSKNCEVNKTHNYIFHDTLKNQLPRVLLQLWRCGMLVTALVFLVSNLRLYFRLRKVRRPLETALKSNVYVVNTLPSSCLFLGAIYVSEKTAADPAALACVLAHEAAHVRHGDDFWALLRCAALVVHWFDPLVWYAARLSQQDGELFADAGALRTLGGDAAENYGQTLIAISTGCPAHAKPLCTATAMGGGKKALRERILQIANRPRLKGWAIAAVLLVSVAAVGCAFAGSAAHDVVEFIPAEIQPSTTPGDMAPGKDMLPDTITEAPGIPEPQTTDMPEQTPAPTTTPEEIPTQMVEPTEPTPAPMTAPVDDPAPVVAPELPPVPATATDLMLPSKPTPAPEPTPEQPVPPVSVDERPFAPNVQQTVRYGEENYTDFLEQRKSNGFVVAADVEGGGVHVLSGAYAGTPHGTSASLTVFYPDAAVHLPLPPRSGAGAADPAKDLHLDLVNRQLTYTATFDETLADVSGEYVIHKAGTYHYTYDLDTRTVSLEIVP